MHAQVSQPIHVAHIPATEFGGSRIKASDDLQAPRDIADALSPYLFAAAVPVGRCGQYPGMHATLEREDHQRLSGNDSKSPSASRRYYAAMEQAS